MKANAKLDQAKQDMVDKLLADMEEKGADWSRDWVDCSIPVNAATGKAYRGRNALLLMAAMVGEGLTDPRFMTFNQAKDAGHKVAKGCHGYAIERWREMWYRKEDPNARVKQPKTKAERDELAADPAFSSRWLAVGHFIVFNARDIEGIEPYQAEGGAPADCPLLDYLEAYSPCEVVEAAQGRAFYSPAADRITLPVRGQFRDEEGAARTLLHEIGHATGHAQRLNRPQKNPFGSAEYAREELIAELTSVFAAATLGFDMPQAGEDSCGYWANHVAYIRNWLGACEGSAADEVMKAATSAAAACDWLLKHCFPDLRVPAEPVDAAAA